MNISDKSLPWDDPAWNSDEERTSKAKQAENSSIKENCLENKLEQLPEGPVKSKDSRDDLFLEFQQFKLEESSRMNRSFTSRDCQQNFGKIKNRTRFRDRKYNNNSFSDHDYGRPKHNGMSPLFKMQRRQENDIKVENIQTEIFQEKKLDSGQDQNEVESKYIDCDKEGNVDIDRMGDENMKKGLRRENVIDNDEDDLVDKGGNQISSDIHRKPAMQIYNSAAVRGKWSGQNADPFQDVREQRRKHKGNRKPRQTWHDNRYEEQSGKSNENNSPEKQTDTRRYPGPENCYSRITREDIEDVRITIKNVRDTQDDGRGFAKNSWGNVGDNRAMLDNSREANEGSRGLGKEISFVRTNNRVVTKDSGEAIKNGKVAKQYGTSMRMNVKGVIEDERINREDDRRDMGNDRRLVEDGRGAMVNEMGVVADRRGSRGNGRGVMGDGRRDRGNHRGRIEDGRGNHGEGLEDRRENPRGGMHDVRGFYRGGIHDGSGDHRGGLDSRSYRGCGRGFIDDGPQDMWNGDVFEDRRVNRRGAIEIGRDNRGNGRGVIDDDRRDGGIGNVVSAVSRGNQRGEMEYGRGNHRGALDGRRNQGNFRGVIDDGQRDRGNCNVVIEDDSGNRRGGMGDGRGNRVIDRGVIEKDRRNGREIMEEGMWSRRGGLEDGRGIKEKGFGVRVDDRRVFEDQKAEELYSEEYLQFIGRNDGQKHTRGDHNRPPYDRSQLAGRQRPGNNH